MSISQKLFLKCDIMSIGQAKQLIQTLVMEHIKEAVCRTENNNSYIRSAVENHIVKQRSWYNLQHQETARLQHFNPSNLGIKREWLVFEIGFLVNKKRF